MCQVLNFSLNHHSGLVLAAMVWNLQVSVSGSMDWADSSGTVWNCQLKIVRFEIDCG